MPQTAQQRLITESIRQDSAEGMTCQSNIAPKTIIVALASFSLFLLDTRSVRKGRIFLGRGCHADGTDAQLACNTLRDRPSESAIPETCHRDASLRQSLARACATTPRRRLLNCRRRLVNAGMKHVPIFILPGFLGLVLVVDKTVLELQLSFSRGR